MNPDGRALLQRGNRAAFARNYPAARQAFEELISAEPASADGYLGLARVLARQHAHEAVVTLLEPIRTQFPVPRLLHQLAESLRVLSYQRRSQDLADRAIGMYQLAVAAKPDSVGFFYLGELLRDFKHDDRLALGAYLRSWELDSRSPTVAQAAVACAERLGSVNK